MNFILEVEAVSQNNSMFGTNSGPSRHQYKKFRDDILNRLIALYPDAKEEERVAFLFERKWGKGKREFDHANLVGGFKPLIDSMTKCGLLSDDTPDLFKGYYFQEKSETDMGYIKITRLSPVEELEVAVEEMSRTFQVAEETLLRIANKYQLIKAK